MGRESLRKEVILLLQAASDEVFRKELDNNRPNVLYASSNAILNGNPELKKLHKLNAPLANEYIKQIIDGINNIGTTGTFDEKSVRIGGKFRVAAPDNTSAVVYINSNRKSKKNVNMFNKLSKDLADVSTKANNYMKGYAPSVGATWNNIDINAGHVYQNEQENSTPVLARAEGIKSLLFSEEGLSTRASNVKFAASGVDISPLKALRTDKRSLKYVEDLIDRYVNAVKKIQLKYSASYDREINANGDILAQLNAVMLIPQEHKINTETIANIETNLGTQLSKVMRNIKYQHLKGSPSILEMITSSITNMLRFGKVNIAKYKSKVTDKSKIKNVPELNAKDVSKRLKLKIPRVKAEKQEIKTNLFTIQNLINEVLAERVKQLMGKSTDPAVRLRYQSGRFADSAVLLSLTRTQAGILAGSWTYMKSPYEVFAPGHRLANGSRDPAIYIEGAIRNAAMSILKTKFPGITLEGK